MNRSKLNLRRCACLLLCLLLLVTAVPLANAEETPSKLVRVGWYEDSYNITGANGERSGYGYEYQQAVAAYTNWNYQYVKAGWSDLMELLQSGDIDVMSGVSYTEERAEHMLFSDLPMGEERYYLYANLTGAGISASDLNTLSGKRVGLLEGSVQTTQFHEWEEGHGLQLREVYVTSYEDAVSKVKNREIDCLVSTETPRWIENGMSAIATIGGSGIYFVINKDHPELKEELDAAMRRMEYDNPFYSDELYQRYLTSVAIPILSSEEQEWLNQHGEIRVGYLSQDSGISTFDADQLALTGVITDYVTAAKNCLGNQALDFTLIGFDSLNDQLRALRSGEIDMIFHMSQNPYAGEINGFSLSHTVLTINAAAITTQDHFNETAENTVAIAKDNILLKWYLNYNYPQWNILECDSVQAAENAMYSGLADCFISESSDLTEHLKDRKLHSIFLTQPDNMSFAVRRGNTTLLSILNKTLQAISSPVLTGALSAYNSSLKKITLIDFIKDNLLAVSTLMLSLFLLILLLILRFLRKSQRAETKAKQEAERSQELNRKLRESQNELQTALLRAESANAAKTTFLNNVSHDIRTPMNAIIGLTSLMENDLYNPEKLHGYLGKLESTSQHLLNLINEILDMNKIESGKVTLHSEPFTIADQVAQLENVIRPQVKARKQTFTIQIHKLRHEHIEGDSTRLQQVLLNILSNAVKYTDNGGKISLDIEEMPREGHYARYRFTITDNGIGMSEEFQKHIYESFTRAENSMTNKVQGTGLGMAITKSIVDMMGGSISLTSELGKGSCFEVVLEFKIDEKAEQAVKKMNLLLLRCSDESLTRIRDATEGRPVTIQRTTSPQETNKLLQEQTYDVILVPYLYYGNGLKTAVQHLRRLAGEETILLGTAPVQRDDALDAMTDSELEGFVPMPFFLSNLEEEVARVRKQRTSGKQKTSELLKGMKFLCAEDNELNAEILQAMLEMHGASCTICCDGQEITEKFRTVQPGEYDAILMDIQMPRMNGYEAARAIRNGENPLGKIIPIIAMTANAFSEDVQKSYEAGMDEHLSKPVNINVLELTLRRFRVPQTK